MSIARAGANFGAKNKLQKPAYQTKRAQYGKTKDESTKAFKTQEDEIAEDKKKENIDPEDYHEGEESGKQSKPEVTTTGVKPNGAISAEAYTKMWTLARDFQIEQCIEKVESSYAPNGITLCQILFEMEKLINGNEELKWKSNTYFSALPRIYYSMMYTRAIMRSKFQAGTITVQERRWLRAFSEAFPDENLPIAGPLAPFFANLAMCDPDDQMFTFVYPTQYKHQTYEFEKQDDKGKRVTSAVTIHNGHFLTPSVMLIADLTKQFIEKEMLTENDFDRYGRYVPFRFETGGTLGGVIFPPTDAEAPLGRTLTQLLLNPILMCELPETKAQLIGIHKAWKRSKFRSFETPRPENEFRNGGLGEATGTAESYNWFEECVDMAALQAGFFKHSVNLSQISPVGGISTLIEFELDFGKDGNQMPETLTEWYPGCFDNIEARARSRTSTMPDEHRSNAAVTITNAKIPWKDRDGNKIGSRDSGMRSGPYWDNRKFNYIKENTRGININLKSMLRSRFYDDRGNSGQSEED